MDTTRLPGAFRPSPRHPQGPYQRPADAFESEKFLNDMAENGLVGYLGQRELADGACQRSSLGGDRHQRPGHIPLALGSVRERIPALFESLARLEVLLEPILRNEPPPLCVSGSGSQQPRVPVPALAETLQGLGDTLQELDRRIRALGDRVEL